MRVLHLADRVSDRGGADVCLRGVLDALAGDAEQRLAVGRLETSEPLPCPVEVVSGLGARTRAPVALDALVARHRPDRIHAHNLMNPAALEWAAERGARLSVQDHRFFCPGRGKLTASGEPCREAMSRELCAQCFDDAGYFDEILALTRERLAAARRMRIAVLSRYMRDELIAAGVPAAGVAVVPPFVHDLDAEAGRDEPPCVLFAGRLVAAKGVRDAVAAWRRSGLGLPLVVAGSGPLRVELEGEPGVRCLGWVGRGALARLYRGARVLVFPSRWQEPFGLAGLEALTLGTPVAAWRSGGVAEWHPGPGLVPWGDRDALAAALASVAGAPASAPSGFDRERTRRGLLALYAESAPA